VSGAVITVKIDDSELKALLSHLQGGLEDLTPAMKTIGQVVRTSVIRNFEKGGRPRWAVSQRVKNDGGVTLSESHRLRNSINVQANKSSVAVGTNVAYAAVHQFGAEKGSFGVVTALVKEHIRNTKSGKPSKVRSHSRQAKLPWGDIPARPFLMVQDEDWKEIGEAIKDHLLGNRE